ncbi:MAG TPA: vitamin B12 dependent-methionine synthase activation domain-containing protein [Bacteroidales bacterium]|nr:vitamin B12 dependent-methionine synthase activation domain-containing protein [Bacteroidales bacterium]
MESTKFSYTFNELLPSDQLIELTMGYKAGEAPEPVSSILREVIQELSSLKDAKAEYKIFHDISLDNGEKSLTIGEAKFNLKGIIFNQIKKSDEIAIFICTAGEVIGEKSHESMKNDDLLRGYIYDVVGSEIVEAAADRLQEELKVRMAEEGKHISNRFSPGYCGWNVSEQHTLFRFYPDNYCCITLTESALMYPVKSVSGIIGIGKEIRFAPYQCKVCDDHNCIYRNRRVNQS